MKNKLLQKQINQYLGDKAKDPEWTLFINAIAETYDHYEKDKILIERSLAISTAEMKALNDKLIQETKAQKLALKKLTESLQLLNYNVENNEDIHRNILTISEAIKKESEKRIIAEEKLKYNLSNLEKINKDLDQFAYVVSHDLKAPLRAISSLAEWIEEDSKEHLSSETIQNLKILRSRAQRMENLIHGILAYTKAGKIKGEQSLINTDKYVHEIIEFLNPPPTVGIKLVGKWPVIETDTIQLHQVFSNLLSNAIKYNDKPISKITISCLILENCCQFSIEDNGPGIEKEYHDKIFGLFQTLQARDHVESTGIGLSIVKKLIEEQGGKIWLQSENGKGTKFTFTWPAKIEKTLSSNILQ